MNSITSDIAALFPRGGPHATPLSDEQKSAIEEILSQYDPEALTEEDGEAIRQQLRESGIGPSRELKQLLEEAGFDPEALRPKGGHGGQGPAPAFLPPVSPSEETLSTLASIFEEYDAENLTEADLLEIQRKIAEAGIGVAGTVIDQRA